MSTTSPNMLLPVPDVGATAGPQYATDINGCMTVIDQHNHAAGSGVPIGADGINLNTSLPFNNNFATNIAGLTLTAQSSTPVNGTLFQASNGTLHYRDFTTGNNIAITTTSGVAGSPGSIANLTSPANAEYVSGTSTFVWQSDTGTSPATSANMDCGAILMRNLSPNSTNAITLQPPTLSTDYDLTLPPDPSSNGGSRIMALSSAGLMTGTYLQDLVTFGQVTTDTLGVLDLGISTAKIATSAVTTAKIADGAVTQAKRAALGQQLSSSCGNFTTLHPSTFADITNLTVTITTTGRPVMVQVVHDGSGSTAQYSTTSGNALVSVVRDSTTISIQQVTANAGVGTAVPTSSINMIDTGATAASHVYKLQYLTTGSNWAFTNSKLLVYEL